MCISAGWSSSLAFLLCLLSLSASGLSSYAVKRIPLSGPWHIFHSRSVWLDVNSGLDMYSALFRANLTGDPLIGTHDTDYRMIANRTWKFSHQFSVPPVPTAGSYSSFQLQWEGVDTFCNVYLNNHPVGNTSNSFLTYTWTIPPGWVHQCGRVCPNILTLVCQPTVAVATAIATSLQQTKQRVPPPLCWPKQFQGECHVNLVRTTQASFGWDWSPAFPIQGFWSLPMLVVTQTLHWRFGEMFKFYAYPSPGSGENMTDSRVAWSADASLELVCTTDSPRQGVTRACIVSRFRELNASTPFRQCFDLKGGGKNKLLLTLTLLRDQTGLTLWWPNGIASGPKLYTLELQLINENGRIVDVLRRSVGFRKVELIEEPVVSGQPELGSSFYFRINGFPVFVKGANWIPARLLPGRASGFMRSAAVGPDTDPIWSVDRLVNGSTSLAGLNLLRVWGGGRYEPDTFYEAADRLGIMIWHDAMFAVSTYPARNTSTPLVNDTVEDEIRQQVQRLHYHPSIVVWSTDNEVKQAIYSGWYGHGQDPELVAAFDDRFMDSVAGIIKQEEALPQSQFSSLIDYQARRCLISSPSNGILTEKKRGKDGNPQNPDYGDIHYYQYAGDLWSEDSYQLARFVSEFGVESLPSALAWWRSLTKPRSARDEWNVHGQLMLHRQHHGLGFGLFELAARPIGWPASVANPVVNYSRIAYVTQLNQMMTYKTYINLMMRHQCRLKPGIPGQLDHPSSMGTVYWQFNDVWSAPSWSTVDAAGQWKMAHCGAVKRTYAPGQQGHIAFHVTRADLVEVDWLPVSQPVEVARQWQPDYFVIQCYSIHSFSPTTEWRVNPPSLHTLRSGVTCPLPLWKQSIEALTRQCGLTGYPRAERILNVMIYKGYTKYGDDNLFMLDRPRAISQWPSTAGVHGLQISYITQLARSAWSAGTPFRPTSAYRLTVTARSPEMYVWLELSPYLDTEHWFDENAFSLVSSSSRSLVLYLHETSPQRVSMLSPESIKRYILITSLATLRQGNMVK